MTNKAAHQTRLERILGVGLAEDAVRQWPQSGELIDGRARIGEVETHFVGLRLGVGRRHVHGDTIVVEWSTDYGDGRVYRNVSIAELRDGKAIRVTDYWGEPFTPPGWRQALATRLDMPGQEARAGPEAVGQPHPHTGRPAMIAVTRAPRCARGRRGAGSGCSCRGRRGGGSRASPGSGSRCGR
jgi:hypothetical protein